MPATPKSLLIVAAVLAAGCAHRPSRLPDTGWEEATSAHFRVYATDGQSARFAAHLERLRAALVRLFPGPPEAEALKIEAVVFPSLEELRWFVLQQEAGYTRFTEQGLRIVMSAEAFSDTGDEFNQTVAHELTHYLSAYAIKHQPRWVAEGLAQVFQTLTLEADGTVVLGRAPAGRRPYAQHLLTEPWGLEGNTLPWLWSWSDMPFDETRLLPAHQSDGSYVLSWAWMHLLLNQARARLEAFFAALNRAEPEREAFARAFADLPQTMLDASLRDYLARELPEWTAAPVANVTVDARVRPLPRAEVHALRAKLFALDRPPVPDLKARFDDEVRAALKLDPKQALARMLLAVQLPDRAAQRDALVEIAGTTDAPDVWNELALHLISEPGASLRAEALARVAARQGDPRAQTIAAMAAVTDRDPPSAREHIERALLLAPWSTQAHLAADIVFKSTGDCTAAANAERSLSALLRHASDTTYAAEVKKRLGAIECRSSLPLPEPVRNTTNPFQIAPDLRVLGR